MNRRLLRHACLAAFAAVTTVACENTSPFISSNAIVCPSAASGLSIDGGPVVVHFTGVAAVGDASLTTTCTPASGTPFDVGLTTVNCTARDSRQQTSSCSFPVTVTAVPRLTQTRFMAFGDSITAGQVDTTTCQGQFGLDAFGVLRIVYQPRIFDPTRSYPPKLQTLLRERYAYDAPVVINDGLSAERVEDGAIRFPGDLTANNPQAVLIQEGANNMLDGNDLATSVPQILTGLRTMIRTARQRNITVFVGTLLPKRAGACRGGQAAAVAGVNDQIKALLVAEGVSDGLVDLYAAFGGQASTDLIAFDGLHPTEGGNVRIAETFYAAIRQKLEARPGQVIPQLTEMRHDPEMRHENTKTRNPF